MVRKSVQGLRVLFIHGYEAEANSGSLPPLAKYLQAQADYLEWHFSIFPSTFVVAEPMEVMCDPNVAWNLKVFSYAAWVREFKPDVIVGSSLGGTILLKLLQDKTWEGPTVLLAPLMSREIASYSIPDNVACTVVHGSRDSAVTLRSVLDLASTGTDGLVRLVQLDDDHELRYVLGEAPATAERTPIATEDQLCNLVHDTHKRHHSVVYRRAVTFKSRL
eukprot:gnl/MRDRNA2_/MRDRNA2_80450_c0_seq1.p1 gnl/MRDRNA2_/MRDRNA2_80450_c0~~gnl/MRDRNA2_/MRDRNA2_80450_c0_seq1.p1  ORF type:complete len:219 (-),score=43.47 gnl/MRDRNA2_/MRDRNA2_80450_c0_seq1:269-925(-)